MGNPNTYKKMKIAIISDIHEDVESLKKALKLIEKQKCDEIYFIGDVVGFADQFYSFGSTKNANECINLLKTNCKQVVVGNHDLFIAKRIPELYKARNFPENWYDLTTDEQRKISENKVWLYQEEEDPVINDENMALLKSAPIYHVEEFENFNCLFSHFIYPDISGVTNSFPFKKEHYSSHFEFMHEKKCLISFIGHGHPHYYQVIYPGKMSSWAFSQNLKLKNKIIMCPAITPKDQKSGFVTFDTLNLEISAINF